MIILNFMYSYLAEGYSVLTMLLSACSSLALAAAIVIGFHLGRRNHALWTLLIWFALMAGAAVSAAGFDMVASPFVATLLWKIVFMGLLTYAAFWLIRYMLQRSARSGSGNY